MRTLIVYATKYGCTEKCAEKLAGKLEGEVDLRNLRSGRIADLAPYDRVVIGGSMYMGKIQKEVGRFCTEHLGELKEKKLGLFICAMAEGEDAAKELNEAFPSELASAAAAREVFGGEFVFSKMNFLHKMIVKKIAKTDQDVLKLSEESIDRFARSLQA